MAEGNSTYKSKYPQITPYLLFLYKQELRKQYKVLSKAQFVYKKGIKFGLTKELLRSNALIAQKAVVKKEVRPDHAKDILRIWQKYHDEKLKMDEALKQESNSKRKG